MSRRRWALMGQAFNERELEDRSDTTFLGHDSHAGLQGLFGYNEEVVVSIDLSSIPGADFYFDPGTLLSMFVVVGTPTSADAVSAISEVLVQ